ncbi:hypothetical protein NKH16_26470 [Mesorhizobium sp. M1307]|uniref:hypothetical protein n=1 Tax=unclassified Mesorhizobium TaxID=325217 RepID=UPI003335F447
MENELIFGQYAHVAGTFDLSAKSGTIDYVTPIKTAQRAAEAPTGTIHLIGESHDQKRLFDQVVHPQRNSCAPNAAQGTFEAVIPVNPSLGSIRLEIDGKIAAVFQRGQKVPAASLSLGPPDPARPHRVMVNAPPSQVASEGVTYTVQAKPGGSENWQTLAVGLPVPQTSLDVNQFPGAKSVEVRVLQSDGFSEEQIFQETKHF